MKLIFALMNIDVKWMNGSKDDGVMKWLRDIMSDWLIAKCWKCKWKFTNCGEFICFSMICDHCDRLVTSCKKSARHSRNFLRFVCLFICLPCLSHSSDLEKKTSQKIQSQVTRSTGIAYITYCKVPREVESQLYSGNWFRRFSFSFLWEPVGSFCDAPEPPAWKQFVIPQRKRW